MIVFDISMPGPALNVPGSVPVMEISRLNDEDFFGQCL